MARDPSGPPEDFVQFVGRRVPGMRAAAHHLSGNDRMAESLVDELFTAVAGRWRWFGWRERRFGRERIADTYLDRIFSREVAGWDSPGTRPRPPASTEPLPARAALELAGLYWDLGSRSRRRWLMVAGGVVAVLLVGVCAVPRGQSPAEETSSAGAALPPLVDVLPPFSEQGALPLRRSPLPGQISLTVTPDTPRLSAGGTRALAVFHQIGAAPLVLGVDGRIRVLDVAPVPSLRQGPTLLTSPLTTGALAPDGTRMVLLTRLDLVVVDLVAATARRYENVGTYTAAVWLTPQTLLLSGQNGALVFDPRTGVGGRTTITAAHLLTAQGERQPVPPAPGLAPPPGAEQSGVAPSGTAPAAGPSPTGPGPGPDVSPSISTESTALPADLAERAVELLSAGDPVTAPARIRRHVRAAPDAVRPVDTAVIGDGISWLGPWRGTGFLVGGHAGRAARDCVPVGMTLPARYGSVTHATVVLHPLTARVQRTLVAAGTASDLREPLLVGWLDPDTALVRTGEGPVGHLLAWQVSTGQLALVANLDANLAMSVADLVGRS